MKFFFLFFFISSCSSLELCTSDLHKIVKEDQKDRKNFFNLNSDEMQRLMRRDADRREKVRELSRMGCLNSADDYKSAALVYQHGDTPEDYLRSYEWSKKGVSLGDSSQKSMMAMSLDRYFTKSGKRQLFGTQATKSPTSPCFCLEQVEKSFSEDKRVEYTGKSLEQQMQWVRELNQGKDCPEIYCLKTLTPPERGTFQGIW